MGCAAGLVLCLSAAGSWLQEPAVGPSEAAPREAAVADYLPRLKAAMRAALVRTEPNRSPWRFTGETLFTGSYDWHSNVHGHWALLSMARFTQDAELAQWVLGRLTPEALAAERALLADPRNARVGLPYALAWMTVLLGELEQHQRRDHEQLREFRAELERRLVAWCETSSFPEGRRVPDGEGGSREQRFVGDYGSWLFPMLVLHLREPAAPDLELRLMGQLADRFQPERAALAGWSAKSPVEFLHVSSVGETLSRIAMGEALTGAEAPAPPGPDWLALPEPLHLNNVHLLGFETTRLWPLAVAAAEGGGAADGIRRSVDEHLLEILSDEQLWEADFEVVSHWMPQFLWIVIWLAEGRP